MTEEVRQALRICPPGAAAAIDRLPDAGAMEELRLRCGSRPLPDRGKGAGAAACSGHARSCCAAFWSRQRSALPMPCRK